MNLERLKHCRYYRGGYIQNWDKSFPYIRRIFGKPEIAYALGPDTEEEKYALEILQAAGIHQSVADIPIELLAHLFVSHDERMCKLPSARTQPLTSKLVVECFFNEYIPEYLRYAAPDRGQLEIPLVPEPNGEYWLYLKKAAESS